MSSSDCGSFQTERNRGRISSQDKQRIAASERVRASCCRSSSRLNSGGSCMGVLIESLTLPRPYDLPCVPIRKPDDLDNTCAKSLVLQVLLAQAFARQIIS